jgi:hypothetical protein
MDGIKPGINLDDKNRPEVILIDEVDVFFSDSFFGNLFKLPVAKIMNDVLSSLSD